jgi:hypothetical protein
MFGEIILQKTPVRTETRIRNQFGDWKNIEVQAAPVTEKDEDVDCVVIVAQGTTVTILLAKGWSCLASHVMGKHAENGRVGL